MLVTKSIAYFVLSWIWKLFCYYLWNEQDKYLSFIQCLSWSVKILRFPLKRALHSFSDIFCLPLGSLLALFLVVALAIIDKRTFFCFFSTTWNTNKIEKRLFKGDPGWTKSSYSALPKKGVVLRLGWLWVPIPSSAAADDVLVSWVRTELRWSTWNMGEVSKAQSLSFSQCLITFVWYYQPNPLLWLV